jgi:hypothetical protein
MGGVMLTGQPQMETGQPEQQWPSPPRAVTGDNHPVQHYLLQADSRNNPWQRWLQGWGKKTLDQFQHHKPTPHSGQSLLSDVGHPQVTPSETLNPKPSQRQCQEGISFAGCGSHRPARTRFGPRRASDAGHRHTSPSAKLGS